MHPILLELPAETSEAVETASAFATLIQSVGIPIGIIAIVAAFLYLIYRKRPQPDLRKESTKRDDSDDDTTPSGGLNPILLLIVLPACFLFSGCFEMFNATVLDESATEANAKAWREFEADSEKWWEDAKYPDSLRDAYRIRFRGATENADAMHQRAKEAAAK